MAPCRPWEDSSPGLAFDGSRIFHGVLHRVVSIKYCCYHHQGDFISLKSWHVVCFVKRRGATISSARANFAGAGNFDTTKIDLSIDRRSLSIRFGHQDLLNK